jgi:lysozyme family protein
MYLDIYIEALIGKEGGFSNHPVDKGGPTMYGITEQVARAFGYDGLMTLLPKEHSYCYLQAAVLGKSSL